MESSIEKPRPRRLRRRARYLIFGGLMMTAIGAASLLPVEAKRMLHTSGHLHTALHVFAFAVLGYLSFRGVRSARAHLLLIGVGVFLAIATEFGEHLIYRSPVEYRDIAADGLGFALGWGYASIVRRRRTRHPQG